MDEEHNTEFRRSGNSRITEVAMPSLFSVPKTPKIPTPPPPPLMPDIGGADQLAREQQAAALAASQRAGYQSTILSERLGG